MVLYAETIYLKDGSVLKGTITEETQETMTIEYGDKWKEVDKTDIKKIVRKKKPVPEPEEYEEAAPEEVNQPAKPKIQTKPPVVKRNWYADFPAATGSDSGVLGEIKLSYDMPAKLNMTSSLGSGYVDMESGFTLGLDVLQGYKTFGAGAEIHYSMSRGIKDAPEAKISFLAFLGVLEISNYDGYRNDQVTPYIRIQGGMGLFGANTAALGSMTINNPGAVFGGSVGIRKKQGLMAELTYNYYTASTSYESYTFDYNYSPIRLSVGYAF
ncbi:MAG: hypothetical protein KKH28_02315 [Elusimicrobia bacterium]|nr:hypothetical protein [Elusimicrobiota bacterium]